MNKSRFAALMALIAAGASAPLAAFPSLLKSIPKERKPHPMMVTASAAEIQAWNDAVKAQKAAKVKAKIERRRAAAFSLGTEDMKARSLRHLNAAIKQRMSELARGSVPYPIAE